MDIDSAEKELTSLDKFLTTLKGLLKKHWGIILIVLVVLFVYWACTTTVDEPTPVQYIPYEPAYIESQEYLQEEQPQEYYEEEEYTFEPAPYMESPQEEPDYNLPVDVVYPE